MATYMGDYPAGHTAVVLPFDTFAAATGAPTATTNFAAADIQVYKDGGGTQRSSSAGIVVSTSFDSSVGLQLVTIDLSDNTDAGFYAAGHEYSVAVSDITVDGQTLRFWLGSFSIERAGGALALLKGGTVEVSASGIRLAVGLSSANLDTQLGDLPTNGELTTAINGADDATLAAIAALNNLSEANIRTAVGLGSANLDTQLGDLPTNAELTAALAAADDAILAAIAALNSLSAADIRTALGMTTGNLDTQLDAIATAAELTTALAAADDAILAAITALTIPSAIQNADAFLTRDWTSVTGEANRSALNALRALRNKWSVSGATLTVTKENDTTTAWTAAVVTTGGDPVSSVDPA